MGGRRLAAATGTALAVAATAVTALLAGASYARGGAAQTSAEYVTAIQVHPKRANIVYASSLDHGVLKSTDGGQTWSAANRGLTIRRVYALALDPRSPNVLYAGTGLGVFKTSDGAKTWRLASTGIDLSGDSLWHRRVEGFIWAIAAHGSTVYATGDGVWRSTNGGATWRSVLPHDGVYVAIDTHRPQTVYASPGNPRNTPRGSINKTVDGGRRWHATGPAGVRLRDLDFVGPVVVDHRPPGTVYASVSQGLFASANQGRRWRELLSLGSAPRQVRAIALDPVRANILYVGTWGRGVMKSDDGGQTWSALCFDGSRRGVPALAIAPTDPETIYAGVRWFTGPDTQTGGMFASTDGGATWRRLF